MSMEVDAPSDPLYQKTRERAVMNPMRRITLILVLLLVASCASQTQPKAFSAQVFEQRGTYRATSVSGQHAFMVRLANRSGESISVDSVSLEPQTTSLQFYENEQAVDDIIEPGETRDFTMWISVNAVAMSYVYTIDSVDVVVTAHSATRGNFTERLGCSVIASR
jgi:uncharacterized membrane protein